MKDNDLNVIGRLWLCYCHNVKDFNKFANDVLNLREDFNAFKKNYKGKCANKVYYYFFKSINQLNAYYKAR